MRVLVTGIAALAATAFAVPAHAAPGDVLIKIRGGYALHSGSSKVAVDVDGTPVTAKVKGSIQGEASFTFFLTGHIATEIALGGLSYDVKDGAGRSLSSAGLITPYVTLQYHLLPESRLFRPYVGVGAAYANVYSEKPGEILTDRQTPFPIAASVAFKGALAPVAQIGADIAINDRLYINVDGKYLGSNSKVTIDTGTARETLSHRMRSTIIGAGVGFRF